jgi:hypothetical protein
MQVPKATKQMGWCYRNSLVYEFIRMVMLSSFSSNNNCEFQKSDRVFRKTAGQILLFFWSIQKRTAAAPTTAVIKAAGAATEAELGVG